MYELNEKEKVLMYQLQAIIPKEKIMTESILRELVESLSKGKKDDINVGGIHTRVQSWWKYVGQWAWMQTSVSKNKTHEIVETILHTNKALLESITEIPRKILYVDPTSGPITTAEIRTEFGPYSLYFQYVPWDGTEEGEQQVLKELNIDPEASYTILAYCDM